MGRITGGAISAFNSIVQISRVGFTDNAVMGTGLNHTADSGGAIAATGTEGRLTIRSSNFQGNTAFNDGGAIFHVGDHLLITDSFIGVNIARAGDSAVASGGIYSGGVTTIRDAVFAENTSSNGGAIFVEGERLNLFGSQVTDNEARRSGGGVYASEESVFTASTSDISGNAAFAGSNVFEEA